MNYSDEMIYLEYHPQSGYWHHNIVTNGVPNNRPDTYGWETIAYTERFKGDIFCAMMDCELHELERRRQKPFTTEYVKRRWKEFCYAFNEIVAGPYRLSEKSVQFTKEHFNSNKSLAKLGHGCFYENECFSRTVSYNPYSYLDANI